ncbi:efflux RND transporter permease subunit [Akkermansiaceae bacterium]|nr:efflux RND transporter permease subunit [Akkermansiaceae bacterium]
MIRWFAKNDIVTNLLMFGILFVGFFIALPEMPVEINPVYNSKSVQASFYARGYKPADIERLIVIPLENNLRDIEGIEEVRVWVRSDKTFFDIRATDDADLLTLKNEVQDAVNNLTTLPSDANIPNVFIPDQNKRKEVISIMLSGNLTNEELIKAARRVRDELITKGIGYLQIQGIKNRNLFIEPTLASLDTHDISLSDISNAIAEHSVELSAGTIGSAGRGFIATTNSQATTIADFARIPIKTINGADLTIGDVATISDTADQESKIVMLNDKPCIRIEAMRLQDESALEVANLVNDYIKTSKNKFPEGIELSTWDDESVSLRDRIDILKDNLIQGILLVIIVLALFLRPSIAFFVVAGIPISFAGGLLIMHLMGVSINMWTLFGFIIVLGIIVDDAIVTAENIHSHLERQTNKLDAVVEGTKEVTTPVTFGVLTTMAAFVPLMYLNGPLGNISKQIPLVIIPVLFFSLIESKLILPGHLKHQYNYLNKVNPFPFIHRYVNKVLNFLISKIYQPTIRFCLHFRHAVVIAASVVLVITLSYLTGPNFKRTNMPVVDKNMIYAEIEMPADTEMQTTHEKVQFIASLRDQLALDFPDGNTGKSLIGNVFHSTGGHTYSRQVEPNKGVLYLDITPPSLRAKDEQTDANNTYVTNDEIADRWRELIGEIKGAKSVRVRGLHEKSRAFDNEKPIEIEIRGDNEENKKIVTEEITKWIDDQYWGTNAYNNLSTPGKQVDFRVNEYGKLAGLTERSLSRQIREKIVGIEAQKFQQGEDEVKVFVKLPRTESTNAQSIKEIMIQTKDGFSTLNSVATMTESEINPAFMRIDNSRIFRVFASTTNEEKSRLDVHLTPLTAKLNELGNQYPGTSWRYTGEIARNAESEKLIKIGGSALMLVIFTLLAIPFKSVIQPFFIMIAVPLGVVGAILGHYHMGVTVSYLSLFGVLALSGVVVNDSLVIIDYINKNIDSKTPIKDVIMNAGIRRFRPIILTSLTTFAGLYPIMTETSPQSAFLKPMAISLGFGILYATVITLILIPCVYLVFEDIKVFLNWLFMRKPKSATIDSAETNP